MTNKYEKHKSVELDNQLDFWPRSPLNQSRFVSKSTLRFLAAHLCSKLDIHEALQGSEDDIERKVNVQIVFANPDFIKVETLKKIHCGGSGGEERECCKILQGSFFF